MIKKISKLLMTSFSLASFSLCSNRQIEIENDCNYPMHILANSADLKIEHHVVANSHSKITAVVTPIPNMQGILLNAITNNSVQQIIHAIHAGANVNLEINGKKPLEWAMLLGHIKSIKCLVAYGAIL